MITTNVQFSTCVCVRFALLHKHHHPRTKTVSLLKFETVPSVLNVLTVPFEASAGLTQVLAFCMFVCMMPSGIPDHQTAVPICSCSTQPRGTTCFCIPLRETARRRRFKRSRQIFQDCEGIIVCPSLVCRACRNVHGFCVCACGTLLGVPCRLYVVCALSLLFLFTFGLHVNFLRRRKILAMQHKRCSHSQIS